MQNWTGCNDLGSEETILMEDSRDYPNNIYTVAKLKDGRCWMTQNLRIGKDESMILSSADSDITDYFVLPKSSKEGFVQDDVDNIYIDDQYDRLYGGYYTWFAATAGQGTKSFALNSQVASESICPKGWDLPTKEEAQKLANTVTGDKYSEAQKPPLNFVTSGRFSGGVINNCGLCGTHETLNDYWTSTGSNFSNEPYAYLLLLTDVNNSGFYVMHTNIRNYYGGTVRCISQLL